MDAVRIGVPVIVVPNTALLDNHQLEFAEQMARMDYAVHGDIKCAYLAASEQIYLSLTCRVAIYRSRWLMQKRYARRSQLAPHRILEKLDTGLVWREFWMKRWE